MDALGKSIHEHFYEDQVDQGLSLLNSLTVDPSEMTAEMAKLQEDQVFLQQAKLLLHSTDWRPVSAKDNIVVESKGSSTEFFCKATTSVEAGLFPVISVIAEVELLHNWVPNVTAYEIFFEPTHFRKCVWYNFWFPWPFSNRGCFMECMGVPIPEEKAALIILRSPREPTYLGQEIPGAREATAKLDMEILVFYVKSVDEGRTDFTLILKAQPNLVRLT